MAIARKNLDILDHIPISFKTAKRDSRMNRKHSNDSHASSDHNTAAPKEFSDVTSKTSNGKGIQHSYASRS